MVAPMHPTTLIVHCSDSPYGTVELLHNWHLERGFAGLGYHYVITNGFLIDSKKYYKHFDGRVWTGRDEDIVGAHVKGRNHNSLGICLIGKHGGYSANQMALKTEDYRQHHESLKS